MLFGHRLMALLAVLSTGCPLAKDADQPRVRHTVRVKSFADIAAVRLLVSAPPYMFSAADRGLERWDLSTGELLRINTDHGLPGDRVQAMTYDAGRNWLWVATDKGLTRYDVGREIFDNVRDPPRLDLDEFTGVVLAPAADGGVWIGHERGLVYADATGRWKGTDVSEPVHALMLTRNGWLWVAAGSGILGLRPDGALVRFGREQHCDVARVRFFAEAPGGTPLAVGTNKDGEERVVLMVGGTCATYRAAPHEPWLAAAKSSGELVVLTEKHLYSLSAAATGARSLTRDGMRLVPVAVNPDAPPPKSPYVIRALDVALPAEPTALGATGAEVLVGTRYLGTARLPMTAGQRKRSWLRRGDLVEEATALSVACVDPKSCFVATGGRYAWHYDGAVLTRARVQGLRVLAFVKSARGDIHALTRNPDNDRILAYRYEHEDDLWSQVEGLEVEVPGQQPELRCARFAPGGLLWLGLAYRDETGETRSYGTAVADLSLGVVVYHRASADDKDVLSGVLPIPIGVVDVAFLDDDVWLATSEGATLVSGQDIQVFSEANGLRSELLRGVTVSPGGVVLTASGRGVASFDGTRWSFPKMLAWPVNDVEAAADGRLWMATDRGVAVYDGARVRRLDERRGLLQDEIDELAMDQFDRIWARGSQGITIITP